MIFGFTGTRKGMTPAQQATVRRLVAELTPAGAHHGDAIGADADFHAICLEAGVPIHVHPPTNPKYRAFCQGAASVAPPGDYRVQDR